MNRWHFLLKQGLLFAMIFGLAPIVHANPNIEDGKHIDQEKCIACHAKKSSFGDGDMIYTRSDSKVTSLAKLKNMVSMCNSELRLDLFPEDEVDVMTYLNSQFYKFNTQQK
jgi:cytochrome c